ncbi:MAG: AAA family ATPase [Gallionella sp.]|nr:AAA family ATPase [Gallionella sp.]
MSTPPTIDRLQLILLGGFDARLNGRSVNGFTYNKMRALLAYLAIEREQDHRREFLADLLWSSNAPGAARSNLRRTLWDLRRVLELPGGTAMFTVGKQTIRFVHNGYTDAAYFTGRDSGMPENGNHYNEEQIIALYSGEFMAGLYLADCPDFENWLQIQRETMHRRALALLEQASNYHEQSGDSAKSLQFALRYTELEPWDEDAHRRVMHLYALSGQSKAAIAQFETCCRLLKTELGVLPGKEIRQLVERIHKGELGINLSKAVITPAKTSSQSRPERRQVTVLYCELSPVTVDDPDEVMELLGMPQARCVEIIRQFSGHVVQAHGGGLLAYFGYPQAHEDAARHAVQAALAVTGETTDSVHIRAGIHTGLIITGGDSSVPDTVGKTSKLAIQLRHSAQRSDVVISRDTNRVVAGYFDCISLGVKSLYGLATPLEIFKVIQQSGARTRLEAAGQLTPLVGRQAEIAKLLALWEASTQGACHIVLVLGEAGIGKSRLLHALKERLDDRLHAIREIRCFPELSQSPFYPLIAMLEAAFDFEQADTPGIKSGKLIRFLEASYTASAHEAIPLLGQLLSLPSDAVYPMPDLTPQKQKEQTIAILLDMLQTLAAKQPMLLIAEDLHWIDTPTLELLTRFVEKTDNGPVLALFTARPEFDPPWKDAIESTLELTPLAESEMAEIITSVSERIPAEIILRIVERADGVPLFAEEMAKIASSDNQASVPATLHDLLAARIDRLSEAKYTAQLAATLGREFNLEFLRKIFPCDPAALTHSLHALQDAGLILKINKTTCQFKHALIQEAAYQSQTRAARQAAHRHIAQVLLSDFPAVVTTQPELLAQHLASGGEIRQSIEYWIQAGQRSVGVSAIAEAIGHFNTGLHLLMKLPPDVHRDGLESRLRLNLGAVLIAAKGYGSVEAGEAYSCALALGECVSGSMYQALWGMWLTSSSRIGHLHSLELAEQLLRMAEQNNEPLQLQQALYAMGNSLLWTGQLEKARLHLERSIALYQPTHRQTMVSEFGENICVSCGAQLAWVLWLMGFPEQACEIRERTLDLARHENHSYSLCYVNAHNSALSRWMRQIDTTRLLAEETMQLANHHGFPVWLLSGTALHGWAVSMQGQKTGIAHIEHAIHIVHSAMSGIEAFFLGLLSEALVHSGQFEAALLILHQTTEVINAKDDRFLESEVYRLKGECLLGISETNEAEAEACFTQALGISHLLGAKSLELRAAMSMARLWQQQGRQEGARLMLAKIYNGFTEGINTPDLLDAADLLRTLT